ncbi:HAD family hydrolase [Jannaschia sp. 2305UL9-9]|uniref:HAD family hydrolase n=1 Tax=Jannaschia sp. 2305UL9-9 TaxID=3121638 RepID=UPI00352777C5
MKHSAILMGAIGTVAETSELQRRAFNLAFAVSDLEWVWEPQVYYRMLHQPGGRNRIAQYAEAAGDKVDADALHQLKEQIFAKLVAEQGLQPRDGLTDLIAAARADSVPVAFCTTTSEHQVDLVLSGLEPAMSRRDFTWIGNRTVVENGKPAPDIYLAALTALGANPEDALVIEDTPESAEAALSAGLHVVGFPGRAARDRAFPAGVKVVDTLDPAILMPKMGMAAE